MASFIKEVDDTCRLTQIELAELQDSVPIIEQDGRKFFKFDDMLFLYDETLLLGGFNGKIWTNSRVFYQFDTNVTQANQTNFLAACSEWSQVTNINFIQRSAEQNYIYVQSGTTNDSAVGMIGGRQIMNITSWNSKFIIAHEIAHALGMVHEQSRSDRDTFVRINTNNIIQGQGHNFIIQATSNYTPYDFASIMHYSATAFSSNQLNTIEAQSAYSNEQQFMGNRQYLTSRDAASMYIRYGRP
jgi:hypothetical protein